MGLSRAALVCVATGILGHGAAAAESLQHVSPDGGISFVGGVGYTFLRGDEIVYDEFGNRISHLIWESDSPVLTAGVKAELRNNWTISGNFRLGALGDSHMEDYDWLDDYWVSYDWNDWTDRSVHTDTKLHRYIDLDLALGRDFAVNDNAVVNLHGGFKYTNVAWTAFGGSYTYSWTGYRNEVGVFPDGERGISFEQRYPGLFLGAEVTADAGAWTFSGLLRGGATVSASDTDHHFMRDLRFEEEYEPIPFVSLGARVDYAFNEKVSMFLGANYDQYFRKTGDSAMFEDSTGDLYGVSEDGAGMKFRSVTLTTGVKVAF